jgi:hypothetical protein
MAADAGSRTTKAVNASGCLDIALQFMRRYGIRSALCIQIDGLNDVGFDPVDALIGFGYINNQITHNRSDIQGFYLKSGGPERVNGIFDQQLTGQQRLSINLDGAASALTVLAG